MTTPVRPAQVPVASSARPGQGPRARPGAAHGPPESSPGPEPQSGGLDGRRLRRPAQRRPAGRTQLVGSATSTHKTQQASWTGWIRCPNPHREARQHSDRNKTGTRPPGGSPCYEPALRILVSSPGPLLGRPQESDDDDGDRLEPHAVEVAHDLGVGRVRAQEQDALIAHA